MTKSEVGKCRLGVLCLAVAFLAYLAGHCKYQGTIEAQAKILSETKEVSPTPTPVPLTETQQIIKEIERVFGKDAPTAIRVARCESGLKSNAVNKKTLDYGIFQINKVHAVNPKFLMDWRINIQIAKHLFEKSGWNPWNSSRRCWSR